MTTEKMKELLSAKDEKITIEYKSCTNEISESVYETVSSFSNRYGGWIIMGVCDGGIPIGVNRNAVKDMKRNFVSQLNNTNKMSPTLYLPIEEFEYEGKILLWTYVTPTSTVIRCAGRVYDRNNEGDFDITDSPIQMENMYARKTGAFSENKLFPYATEDDLHMELMPTVRRLIENKNAQHEWLKMTDHEIMISAGLYEKNLVTGEEGYNLAAIMLFGKDDVIRSCVSGYVTDAIYRVENMDRYDDRLQVSTNLIESYDRLMEFIAKHTSDKFCLINNVSTSIRDVIAREVVSNILVHRDFSSAYPKNPLIANFFTALGRSDTIGSGVKNLYKYTPIYSGGGNPELYEADVFRITIPLTKEATRQVKMETELTEREQLIYNMISENQKISVENIAAKLDVTRRTVLRDVQEIKKKVFLLYDKKEALWKLK
ncbi:MAG: HTH domain-containing protein [Lachnospiraceae bacterium]|nr:HTH domain-containing protein [Lachnospiraceae bacterium]